MKLINYYLNNNYNKKKCIRDYSMYIIISQISSKEDKGWQTNKKVEFCLKEIIWSLKNVIELHAVQISQVFYLCGMFLHK